MHNTDKDPIPLTPEILERLDRLARAGHGQTGQTPDGIPHGTKTPTVDGARTSVTAKESGAKRHRETAGSNGGSREQPLIGFFT